MPFEAARSDLHFPVATAPAPGEITAIAPGVLWLRLPLPFQLDHVNIYLIEDGPGWAVVDAGYGDDRTRAVWEAVTAGALAGRKLTRLIVTHFHPDHVGLAGWLAERFGLPLAMSQTEYMFGLALQQPSSAAQDATQRAFYRRHGLSAEATANVAGDGHAYLRATTGMPPVFRRLIAGDSIRIGERRFQVLTGAGHAPEQVMLHCAADRLFLAADQVLAKISPHIGIWAMEPEADPLGEYLRSLAALRAALPDDVLVLAAHNLPFFGLHARIDQLIGHHAARCDAVAAACRPAPRAAADIVPLLFRRVPDAHQRGFALREVLAHINHMLPEGRLAPSDGTDGVRRFQAGG